MVKLHLQVQIDSAIFYVYKKLITVGTSAWLKCATYAKSTFTDFHLYCRDFWLTLNTPLLEKKNMIEQTQNYWRLLVISVKENRTKHGDPILHCIASWWSTVCLHPSQFSMNNRLPYSSILVNLCTFWNSVFSVHPQIHYTHKQSNTSRGTHTFSPISTKVIIHETLIEIFSQSSNPKHKVSNHKPSHKPEFNTLIPQAGIHPLLRGRNLLTCWTDNPYFFLPEQKTFQGDINGPVCLHAGLTELPIVITEIS